jgi:hypothetical protein
VPLPKRRCANPACHRRFEPRRRDQRFCGADCRSERARLKAEGIATREQWKAYERAQRERGDGSGKRPDTAYAVWVKTGTGMLQFAGAAKGHDGGEAVRKVADSRGDLEPDARCHALPLRSFAAYLPDGSKLS